MKETLDDMFARLAKERNDRDGAALAERHRINALMVRFAAGEDCSDDPAPDAVLYFGACE